MTRRRVLSLMVLTIDGGHPAAGIVADGGKLFVHVDVVGFGSVDHRPVYVLHGGKHLRHRHLREEEEEEKDFIA